jgi:hypothetical protein
MTLAYPWERSIDPSSRPLLSRIQLGKLRCVRIVETKLKALLLVSFLDLCSSICLVSAATWASFIESARNPHGARAGTLAQGYDQVSLG